MVVTRMEMSHEIFNGKLMLSCPSGIRKFVIREKETPEERNEVKESEKYKCNI